MSSSYPNVIVCLPAYNEVESIERMIDGIRNENFEVIVTDGGSTDGTKEKALAKGAVVLERPGKGKGYGMRQAIAYAAAKKYEIIVFLDCDMTYPIDRIKDLVVAMTQTDVVIGVRDYSKMNLPVRIANMFFTSLMNLFFSAKWRDTQSGFRALRTDKFKDVLTIEGLDVEIQITSIAWLRQFRIEEIPIDYSERWGNTKVSVWLVVKILCTIIKCRFIQRYR